MAKVANTAKNTAARAAAALLALILAVALPSAPALAGMFDISDAREAKLGKEAADAFIKHYGLYANEAEARRVEAVGKTVVEFSDRTDIEYHFYLLDTKMVNAFAIPGGFVFMTRGIMDIIDDDDELASVIGHEIAHVAKKHSMTLYKADMRNTMINLLLFALSKDPNVVMAGQMVEQSQQEVFGRKAEIEADRLGLEYMHKAGYEADAFMRFMRKLARVEQNRPELLEDYYYTHPPMDVRQTLVEENYRRIGLEPPEEKRGTAKGRLVAGEACPADGGPCAGVVKGPRGELMRMADPGPAGDPYLRALSAAAALNRLFSEPTAFFDFGKKTTGDRAELLVRNNRAAEALPGDLAANSAASVDELVDMWIQNLKLFIWSDIVGREM